MAYTKTILPENGGKNMKNDDKSKYEEALEQYDTTLNDADVQAAVKQIIEEKAPQNDTRDIKKFLFESIELTTLSTTDTEEKVLRMVEKVNQFDREYPDIPHVAAICVYPVFTELVANSLEVDGVQITNVCGNFPSSQARMEVKVAETQLAVADGATEIDIVMPVGKFLSDDYEGMCDDISEMKQACGSVPMKVILETGDLQSCSNIKKAALLSMYAGADYIKTSTGFSTAGATFDDVKLFSKHVGKNVKINTSFNRNDKRMTNSQLNSMVNQALSSF